MLKTIFMGTPQFAVNSLNYCMKNTDLLAVFTQTDKPCGRGQKTVFSPVKESVIKFSENSGKKIPVYQPDSIRKEPIFTEIIRQLNPDVIVVAAYGQILPEEILTIPKYGCVNIHASLLPRWRGASPISAAILAGDCKTGVSIMRMEKGLDTGAVYKMMETEITPKTKYTQLYNKLSEMGAVLLSETLPDIFNIDPVSQSELPGRESYSKMFSKADLELLPEKDTSFQFLRKVMAYSENPCAFIIIGGKRFKIFDAEIHDIPENIERKFFDIKCSDGKIVKLTEIAPEGKKRMTSEDYLRGMRL